MLTETSGQCEKKKKKPKDFKQKSDVIRIKNTKQNKTKS